MLSVVNKDFYHDIRKKMAEKHEATILWSIFDIFRKLATSKQGAVL